MVDNKELRSRFKRFTFGKPQCFPAPNITGFMIILYSLINLDCVNVATILSLPVARLSLKGNLFGCFYQ